MKLIFCIIRLNYTVFYYYILFAFGFASMILIIFNVLRPPGHFFMYCMN